MNTIMLQVVSVASQYKVRKMELRLVLFSHFSSQNKVLSSFLIVTDVNADIKCLTFRMFLQNGEAFILLINIEIDEILLL